MPSDHIIQNDSYRIHLPSLDDLTHVLGGIPPAAFAWSFPIIIAYFAASATPAITVEIHTTTADALAWLLAAVTSPQAATLYVGVPLSVFAHELAHAVVLRRFIDSPVDVHLFRVTADEGALAWVENRVAYREHLTARHVSAVSLAPLIYGAPLVPLHFAGLLPPIWTPPITSLELVVVIWGWTALPSPGDIGVLLDALAYRDSFTSLDAAVRRHELVHA